MDRLSTRKLVDEQVIENLYHVALDEHSRQNVEDVTAVETGYRLDTPAENNLYEYITEQSL